MNFFYKRNNIKKNILLKNKTTMKIGGKAEYYCRPSNVDELLETIRYAMDNKINYRVLGGGSNLLINDCTISGLIIDTTGLNKVSISGNSLEAEAGVLVNRLCRIAIRQSLSGLEFAYGLPGTIGGAAFMNARCYNGEFSGVVSGVEFIDGCGQVRRFSSDEIQYSYKKSIFMEHPEFIITKIILQLKKVKKDEQKTIKVNSIKNKQDRIDKGQFVYPSAGCVFKNNYSIGISSGKIIDESGLKGFKVGRAMVYPKHANFAVNTGGAGFQEMFSLIESVEQKVRAAKNVTLEREITIWEK